jgi:hypothetical protein
MEDDIGLTVDRQPHAESVDRHALPRAQLDQGVIGEPDQDPAMLAEDEARLPRGRTAGDRRPVADAGERLKGLIRFGVRVADRSARLEVVGCPTEGAIAPTGSQDDPALAGPDHERPARIDDGVRSGAADGSGDAQGHESIGVGGNARHAGDHLLSSLGRVRTG